MNPSTRTPEGQPNECPICGNAVVIEPSSLAGDWALSKLRLLALVLGFSAKSAPLWLPSILDFGAFRPHEEGGSGGDSRSTRRDPAFPGDCKPDVLAALLKREELGSTAIGGGVAVPHAKSADVDRTIGALATFPAGVDFGAADGQPVRRVFVLLSPVDDAGEDLRLLESVSRWLRESAS